MKRTLSLFLSLILVIGIMTSVPLTVNAASVDDLTFELNDDGTGYVVTDCNSEASGELVIPDTYNGLPVTEIGEYALGWCENLTSIIISNNVIDIAKGAFFGCTNLLNLVIPESVSAIGNSAFHGCTKIISFTIPDGVVKIGAEAFAWCTELKKIYFSSSVEVIGENCFSRCDNLTEINVNIGNKFYSSINGVLFNKAQTKLLQYPIGKADTNYTVPDGTEAIQDNAFYCCANLVEVVLPEGIETIGNYSFFDCNNIKTISLSDGILSIGECAFTWNEKLENIKIPVSVQSIGSYAFAGTGIKSVTIPDGVTVINERTFYACNKLVTVNMGNGVTDIVDRAFRDCTNLENLRFSNKLKIIGTEAFAYCSKLKDIVIPDSVKTIELRAFDNCKSMTSVLIPESVENIDFAAFGIFYDSVNDDYNDKIKNFLIFGKTGSAAEKYANDNGFDFVDVDEFKKIKPKIKSASNSGKNVKVVWSKVAGADYYYVYRKISGGSYSYIGKTTKTYFVDESAKAGKTYTYKLRAKSEAGYSSYSSTKTVKHLDQPTLKTPTNTTSGVKVSWGKVSGASGYKVYRKTSDGWKYLGKTTKTYFTDKTVKSGKKYTYTVKAYNSDYNSSYSSTGVSKYYLADPTLKTPTSTKSGISLKWTKTTGAQGYIIYRKTGSGSYKKLKTEKGVSNLSYVDKSAKKGKKYTYKVKAYYSKTYSAYSNTKTIKDKY